MASATVDAEEIKNYFNNKFNGKDSAVILGIEGRQYPVEIHYLKGILLTFWIVFVLIKWKFKFVQIQEPTPCYIKETVNAVLSINSSKEPGDILAFLTGQEEVERAVNLLSQHADLIEMQKKKELMTILPMYGSLPNHDQLKVFRPAAQGYRKVIISTNIAETSITIPGIVYGLF